MMNDEELERRYPATNDMPNARLHWKIQALACAIDRLPDSREKSLALTHLETTQMWLAKCDPQPCCALAAIGLTHIHAERGAS